MKLTWFLFLYSNSRLYVNWRFLHGIEAQFLALQKGFNEVIPQHLLKAFDEKELEVGGKPHTLGDVRGRRTRSPVIFVC